MSNTIPHAPHIHHGPRSDDGNAFLPDPDGGPIADEGSVDSEMLEGYLTSATTGEDAGEDIRDRSIPEDFGGPFVPSTEGVEMADDIDESNPIETEPEGTPSPMRGHR